MELSSDLVSQFVQITKEDKQNKETTVYGTIVEYNGGKYVRLDGSELLTPISSTADAIDGERVLIMIKNHTAIVTGNISSPSARIGTVREVEQKADDASSRISEFEIVIADKVSVERLEAEVARIDSLVTDNVKIKGRLDAAEASIGDLTADNVDINGRLEAQQAIINDLEAKKLDAEIADITYATIENLEATNAQVNNLEATYGEFQALTTEKFSAVDASIQNLEATKLTAQDIEGRFANIDFSNIGKAAIEAFYAKSGLIDDLVVGDGTITGTLVGVTIKGDLIEGGTIVADKLVIKGSDGLYYKLNTDGVTTEAEQTEYNSLNGSIITAQSITATKIAVDDLVAFDATIGGFNITDSSIYSGVKESVDNTTRGIYLDDNGQAAFGDSNNFLKYYRDQNGNYKLDLSASSIRFSTSGKSVEDALSDVEDATNANAQDLANYILSNNAELENLQSQIDGSITTWFYEYEPTNDNIPASDWTTTDLKNVHLGDLFYNTITGYCYRWQVQNSTYSWSRVTDVDVTKALADASHAQDTADSKRRVFVTTPIPPYDVGDLWTQGSSGDLMRCKIKKTSSQSYSATDWEKASKYTDDTAANKVASDLIQLADSITLQVTDGTPGKTAKIVLSINGETQEGTIDLTGAVTFNDLSTSGKTTINGSNITTGTISADRIDAESIFSKNITATGQIQFNNDKYKLIVSAVDKIVKLISWQKLYLEGSPISIYSPIGYVDITCAGNFSINTGEYSDVTINEKPLKIFVIEYGTSNGWYYRKYSDGTCDLWLNNTITGVNITSAIGNWYRSVGIASNEYPFNVYNEVINSTFHTTNSKGALVWDYGITSNEANKRPGYVYLIRPNSVTGVNGVLSIHVHGTY